MNSLAHYIFKRLLFFIPTVLGITILNFGMIQIAPGGPIEAYIAKIKFGGGESSSLHSSGGNAGNEVSGEVIEELKKQYGFDKPIYIRYFNWLKNIIQFDFGYSHTFGTSVWELIKSKFPVSVRFGLASFLLTYLICIPLGVFKAKRNGTFFDEASSFAIFFMYSVPPFMLGILLIVLFAGGSFWNLFPMGGIATPDSDTWSLFEKFKDRVWHMFLPLICFTINNLASLTILTKNSVLDEINKEYSRTARSKGLTENTILFKHVLRNAMIAIVTGLSSILTIFFTSNLLLEKIFNLDGFGKLFFDAAIQRDYPVLMAQVLIGSVLAVLGQLLADLLYVAVDPRIDFSES